ncbi:hypothetical protein KUTeg_021639 [Tegillarca granosa]|uniref:DUF4455 domain-containing protein n=1 Tax=Tegillarca granosa TaxID=220873 RepID=A0ABQ9E9F4_TEGGR|nr:hypothetical protein KUTeg_021639 [Tegillarca granosa]
MEKDKEFMSRILKPWRKPWKVHNNTTSEQIKSLFKYAQGASHVWDVHEIGLAKQERALQEKLETCRHQHDNQNQDKEAHLDVVMDKMRQDAKEEALKDSLNKALDMLEKIKNAYEVFHQEQTDIVKKYPNMVKLELNNYDDAVCKFFMVDRNNPEAGTILPKGRRRKRRQEPVKTEPKQDKKGKKSKEATLPEAVSEILSTDKGTVFYVLTVAGEYGVPPESELEDAKRQATTTFITEDEESVIPDYVINIDIPSTELLEIKKKIRINFLNHLEEWTDQAMQRADSVVIAKCEELNSELDLRLHLHKPRARRAEYDVHNVRAAELVMHSERVVRHTKGIQQSLNELRQRFTEMTKQHNKLAHKFREDIESLEVIFINATKSSRLLTLQNQLGVELEKFMQVIRTSLREFRQHLDKTLQMLRESNARFVKSFKVFSDGGNFCPEEIEDYRKKLDKQSQKIDMAEGSIMSDLEGMESKRLDQATKVALEFEDRFKSHMIDLVFMEKIARWLTNTQVKIKAEVANSNTQAQTLAQHINDLDRRIDACEKPNLDKELDSGMQITSRQLNDTLKAIFEAFHARSVYLNCVTDPAPRPTSATMQGNPALVTRVAFMPDTTPTPISKAGKQPSEDPSVGVIKSILKTQKSKMRFGLDADLDGEGFYSGSPHQEMREKMKSSMSNTPSEKSKSNRKGGHSGGASEPRRVQSGLRRSSKSSKFDKKYMVFGEKDEEGEDKHLLGIIRRTLREALDGLLTSADEEYKRILRPVLGHPHQEEELESLCKKETDRHGTEAQKHPTSELIRRRNAGLPLEDDEEKSALPRGKNTWQGL